MLRLILAALLIGYLPGAFVYRIPSWDRDRRAALEAGERGFWAFILSASWSLAVVIALGLLHRYSFDRLLMVNGAIAALVLAVWRGGLLYRGTARRPSWTVALPAALIGLGLTLYFPPAEYVIGGKDPGVYLNEGVQIAQRGSLIAPDPTIAAVPPAFRDLFFPQHANASYYGVRFMGFFVDDPTTGEVVGQFPHLFPASIAVGYGLNGLSGARQAVGFWAIVGALAVYFAGARLFGRAAGLAAAGLLVINVAEVWFARYPNSELLMQSLLFAAILAFTRALDGSRAFFGAIAGLLLGLIVFLRYEVVLAMAMFVAAAALVPVTRQKLGPGFFVGVLVTAVPGFLYLAGPLLAYFEYPLSFTRDQGGWWLIVGGLAAAGCVRTALSWARLATFVRRALPATLALLLAALAVYAYFYRQAGGTTAPFDARAFETFGWYLTPAVLAVAVVATAVVTVRHFWTSPAFFLTFAIFSVFFFYKTRIVPEHFWAARRFLAMSLPGALLMLTAFLDDVFNGSLLSRKRDTGASAPDAHERPRPARLALGLALFALAVAPIALTFWRQAAPVRPHVEYAGVIPKLEKLAAAFGGRDLVIVESRNAGSDLHTLALPLAYIYARNVLVLNSVIPPKRMLEDFVVWATTTYDHVFFLGGAGTDLLTQRIDAEPIANDRFQIPEYDSPKEAYPSGPRRKEYEYGLYRLKPAEQARSGPIDLTIGALDDLNVVRFFARERRDDTGMTFRWTQGQSTVLLLGMAPAARTVTIWMSNGGRPAQAPPADVQVALGDLVLGTARPVDKVQPYVFQIPSQAAAAASGASDPARLLLRVPTWNPAEIVGNNDTRNLGVIVTRVEVR